MTSFSKARWETRALYEELYCARGDMENRIKEQQLDMFAVTVQGAGFDQVHASQRSVSTLARFA